MTAYRVRHQTSYAYEAPVLHAHHLAHLRPRRFEYQTPRRTLLEITPVPRDQHREEDYFGNDCDVLEVLSPHERFDIVATSEIEVKERPTSARITEDSCKTLEWGDVAEQLSQDTRLLFAREYCFDSPLVRVHPMLREYAAAELRRETAAARRACSSSMIGSTATSATSPRRRTSARRSLR